VVVLILFSAVPMGSAFEDTMAQEISFGLPSSPISQLRMIPSPCGSPVFKFELKTLDSGECDTPNGVSEWVNSPDIRPSMFGAFTPPVERPWSPALMQVRGQQRANSPIWPSMFDTLTTPIQRTSSPSPIGLHYACDGWCRQKVPYCPVWHPHVVRPLPFF
jgi:hypothetical protein